MKRVLMRLFLLALVGIVVYGIFFYAGLVKTPLPMVHYACDSGKTIDATYYEGAVKPATKAGEPPTPTGSVHLVLSDGRTLTLSQTISGSGIRYANAGESIVFWSRGNGAFMTEGGTQTYRGCVKIAAQALDSTFSGTYASSTLGFSIRYPAGYTLDTAYRYQELGPGKAIDGVRFTIPPGLAQGTNLSADSYLSVETLPQHAADCSASLFLPGGATAHATTENGTTWSVASTTGAGAGNRYEETVYAIPGTRPCLAVRYFIHYTVLQNYPAGAVKAFDRAALVAQFDAIRKTLVVQ